MEERYSNENKKNLIHDAKVKAHNTEKSILKMLNSINDTRRAAIVASILAKRKSAEADLVYSVIELDMAKNDLAGRNLPPNSPELAGEQEKLNSLNQSLRYHRQRYREIKDNAEWMNDDGKAIYYAMKNTMAAPGHLITAARKSTGIGLSKLKRREHFNNMQDAWGMNARRLMEKGYVNRVILNAREALEAAEAVKKEVDARDKARINVPGYVNESDPENGFSCEHLKLKDIPCDVANQVIEEAKEAEEAEKAEKAERTGGKKRRKSKKSKKSKKRRTKRRR